MFNHQEPWDNWAEMCFSTPADFALQRFEHPDTCENKVRRRTVPRGDCTLTFLQGRNGIIASWFIDVDERECP